MSVLVRFAPTNVTRENYEESLRRLKEAGEFPPEGMELHVAFGPRKTTCASARSGIPASNCRPSVTS